MKKFLMFSLCMMIVFSLFACSSNDQAKEESQSTSEKTSTEKEADKDTETNEDAEVDEDAKTDKDAEADKDAEVDKDTEVDKDADADKDAEANKDAEPNEDAKTDKDTEAVESSELYQPIFLPVSERPIGEDIFCTPCNVMSLKEDGQYKNAKNVISTSTHYHDKDCIISRVWLDMPMRGTCAPRLQFYVIETDHQVYMIRDRNYDMQTEDAILAAYKSNKDLSAYPIIPVGKNNSEEAGNAYDKGSDWLDFTYTSEYNEDLAEDYFIINYKVDSEPEITGISEGFSWSEGQGLMGYSYSEYYGEVGDNIIPDKNFVVQGAGVMYDNIDEAYAHNKN